MRSKLGHSLTWASFANKKIKFVIAMSYSESDYIEICKKQLEDKFSFGNGHGYSQKDLELLSSYIEDEKRIYLSLSTLKRLWKNDFKQGPQLATLNALVSVLEYDNWQQFKLQNKKSKIPILANHNPKIKLSKSWKIVLFLIIPLLVMLTLVALKRTGNSRTNVSVNGPVIFEVDKTLLNGVPNTAIFKYDVSNVVADSFFIQQSWNKWRRERIDPKKKSFSSIYYESGFHRARLMANDSVIALQPVHVLSAGWEPHVYYNESDDRFIDFKGESFIDDGMLHLSAELLSKKKIDTAKDFISRISNSKAFAVSSNDFHFSTKVKADRMTNSNCPWLIVQIVTERHVFYVKLVGKGCEVYATYKLGEIIKKGRDNDLALLGQNIFEWQEIGIKVENKHAEISINGSTLYTEKFEEDFGKVMGLSYIFDGKGSIDYAKFSNALGETVFEDDFDK